MPRPAKPARQNVARPEPWGIRLRRAVDAPYPVTRSRSGKSAAPASPAAARRSPCPPGGSLAVRSPTRDAVSGRSSRQQRARPAYESALVVVRRHRLRLVQREPAHGVHLLVPVPEAAAHGPHEEEAHALEDAQREPLLVAAGVPVGHIAEALLD